MRTLIAAILTFAGIVCADPDMDSPKPNAFYVAPITTWIYSAMNDIPVVSLAYERQLSSTGWGLFVPVHFAYSQGDESQADEYSTNFLLGAGVGLRKFIGHPFSGSYLTAQSDFMQLHESGRRYEYANDGTYTYALQDYTQSTSTSISQLAYGYKFLWSQFVLDMNLGGAFYIQENEKHTYPIGAINLGFPFDAKTFDL